MPWTRGISDDPEKSGNLAAVKRYQAKNPEKMAEINRLKYERNMARIKAHDSLRHRRRREKRWATASRPRPKACEICGEVNRLVYDHCHKTGKFRGWLCSRCNRTLGQVKDSVELLKRMEAYLNAMDAQAS